MKILAWQGKWEGRESRNDDSTLPKLLTSQMRSVKVVILIIWIPVSFTSMRKYACYLVKLILIPKLYKSRGFREKQI